MPNRCLSRIAFLALTLALPTQARAEDVGATLKRQTQEVADAVGSGSVAVWDKYLDSGVLFVDESGTGR